MNVRGEDKLRRACFGNEVGAYVKKSFHRGDQFNRLRIDATNSRTFSNVEWSIAECKSQN